MNHIRHFTPFVVALFVFVLTILQVQWTIADESESSKLKAREDYAAQLPRIPPKSPAEALKSFQLNSGLRIELVAAEPDVASPVAMDFDEHGRMYVAEFPEFNQSSSQTPQGRGRIRLLLDTDADGVFDNSTIFLGDLDSPTAVSCYDGGVFVGSVPDIIYAKDTDGDGIANLRRVVFTGFGRDALGEGMLNSFHWSFDNRIHVQTSLSGGTIRHADRPNDRPVSVRGEGFMFDPRKEVIELSSGGGQHGMSFDDWGRTFVNTNNQPIQMLMYDRRYIARNPFLEAPVPALSITPGGYNAKIFRISPDEPWRVVRTRLRTLGLEGERQHPTERDLPSGFFTACSGVTVYRGDALPPEYRGNVFVGEVANNLVHRTRLESNGVGLTAVRTDAASEFLASSDIWFRPVQMANGPDGGLYVIDMYRHLIQGAAFLSPTIVKHLDVGGGFDMGRIYRVVPEGFKQPKTPRLSRVSTSDLVALLEHQNGWHRDTASRLLYQRQDLSAAILLKRMAVESRSPLGRMHALYALAGLHALDVATVMSALGDTDSRVREHALRLAESFEDAPEIPSRMAEMVDDSDLRVRYQLAFSLGALRSENTGPLLAKLARRDCADAWFHLALLSSIDSQAGHVFGILNEDKEFRNSSPGREFLKSLAMLVGSANRRHEIDSVVRSLEGLPAGEDQLLKEIVRNLAVKLTASGRDPLSRSAGNRRDVRVRAAFEALLRDALATAPKEQSPEVDRVAAIRTLGLLPFVEVKDVAAGLLNVRQPQFVQSAALAMLGRYDEPQVPAMLLDAWPSMSPPLRASATEVFFSRTVWIEAYLDAVERGTIHRGDVDPARIRTLASHPLSQIRTRAAGQFDATRLANRGDVVATYRLSIQTAGDRERGQAVFAKNCAACHLLHGVGTSIGADLNAIRDQSRETILLNILDPNREVKPQFLGYTLLTDSGRTIAGMIRAETANSLTIQRADGTAEPILRIDIEELRSTGVSFMPEGLEKLITVSEMADLLAFLTTNR